MDLKKGKISMTVYVKFDNGKYVGVFRDMDAIDKDRMEYQIAAKAYYNLTASSIDYCIDEAKDRIKTFSAFLSKVTEDSHNHLLLESDIKKARQDLENYETIKVAMVNVDTPLDYCKFYCENHGIKYRLIHVKE